jgi:solute carrier family 40 (iron-regulated transporter), member 1
MLSYASTIVFSRPAQFRYPVLLSVIAVYGAGFLYGIFLRKRRGHLVHVPRYFKGGERGMADTNI